MTTMVNHRASLGMIPICALALCMASAVAAPAQTAAPETAAIPARPRQKTQEAQGIKTSAKAANLQQISLAPVDPMALAQSIRPAAESTSAKTKPSASSADAGVMEFHAVTEAPTTYTAPGLASKDSKQSLLKNIHGEASGALASGADGAAQAANAAVGASSKSGKIHIFIKTEHNQDSAPH